MSDIDKIHASGEINDYLHGILLRTKDVVDLNTWVECVDDAILATKLGVNNDKDFQTFHYIDLFVDDVAKHMFGVTLSAERTNSLKGYMFDLRHSIDFGNLVAFFMAILKWLSKGQPKELDKVAYPNRGIANPRIINKANLPLWAKLALKVRGNVVAGHVESDALIKAAAELPERDKLDFMAWYKFKYGRYYNIYNVNGKIARDSEGYMSAKNSNFGSKVAFIHEDNSRYYLPEVSSGSPYGISAQNQSERERDNPMDSFEKREKETLHGEARSKLVSRTFAIDRLLEKYYDILGPSSISEIEDILNVLRKKIRSLKLATVVYDSMVKSANQLRNNGFSVGASVLENQANDFIGNKPSMRKIAFSGDDPALIDILTKLQTISNELKRRDIVRDIAKLDFKLHDMNASALFPELSEAQAKLIDATTYASNKLEDVIPKLRSFQRNNSPDASVTETVEHPLRPPTQPSAPRQPPNSVKSPPLSMKPSPAPAAIPDTASEAAVKNLADEI